MKNNRHIATNDAVDNRMEMSHHRVPVPVTKLLAGSVAEKYPVVLDDGRTIVYITDKSREREVRLRYELRKAEVK